MLYRKFYRLQCLSNIFKVVSNNFQVNIDGVSGFTDSFREEYKDKIDKYTILFITATSMDEGKYIRIHSGDESSSGTIGVPTTLTYTVHASDTMIWARGQVYAVSTKSTNSVTYDETNNILTVNYTDGTSENLTLNAQSTKYTAGQNILINDSRVISALGYLYDSNKNFIGNSDQNSVADGVSNATVFGKYNKASIDNQTVLGKYNSEDNSQIVIVGNGASDDYRDNIFTISFTGISHAKNDVTAGGTFDEPSYKLSDIHSVTTDDWAIVGVDFDTFDKNSYDDSFQGTNPTVDVTIDESVVTLKPYDTYSEQGYNQLYSQNTFDSSAGESVDDYLIDTNTKQPEEGDVLWTYCNDIYVPEYVDVTIDDSVVSLISDKTYSENGYDVLYSQNTFDSSAGESADDYLIDTSTKQPEEGDVLWTYCNDFSQDESAE